MQVIAAPSCFRHVRGRTWSQSPNSGPVEKARRVSPGSLVGVEAGGQRRLLVGGGCAGSPPNRRCGVVLVRRTLGRFDVLGWAPSGHFPPTVQLKFNPRVLFVYGGDRLSHYRRAVSFEWGSVAISSEQRNKDTPF